MVHKNTDDGTSQSWQKGNIGEGQTLLLSFLSGTMHESSRNGATDHQNQWSPGFPRVGNRNPPTRWCKTTATNWIHAHGKESMTPPASHQVKACKKNSLLEFITSLKVRNDNTAIDAKHQAPSWSLMSENTCSHQLFGIRVLALR